MSALDTVIKIGENDNLIQFDFKYCLVNESKIPFKLDGSCARINKIEDFVDFINVLSLPLEVLERYSGLGISIQGSKIVAIDVDKCFSIPFDLSSGDERAKDIIELFKDYYIEFSFSGKGLRILFLGDLPNNYKDNYYIKNEKTKCEFYHFLNNSYRYVTITGNTICNNKIKTVKIEILEKFLNKYMLKKQNFKNELKRASNEKKDYSKILKVKLLLDYNFQEVWFSKAPGSNSNESELDFYLIKYIVENITSDKETVKEIFESSPYFKSKDSNHIHKWEYNNYRYFNFIYEHL